MTKEEKFLFGNRLRQMRLQTGLTQDGAAERLNISLRYYQMLERGENTGSIDLLISICSLMNCSLDYLLCGKTAINQSRYSSRIQALSVKQRDNLDKMIELWLDSIGCVD